MLFELLLAIGIGILAGTITGLIPGIHVNTLGAILVALLPLLFVTTNPLVLAMGVVAMAITHTFVDFIPSVILGCPDTDTELAILPGHKLLLSGRGYEAIMHTIWGSATGLLLFILFAIPLAKVYLFLGEVLQDHLGKIILLAAGGIILLERNKKEALFVFGITGLLGYLALTTTNIEDSLLPLLSGLFGMPLLLEGIRKKVKIPTQTFDYEKEKGGKQLASAMSIAPLCALIPGMGSGQAAVLTSAFSKPKNKEFLILLGAINTVVMGCTILLLFTIERVRSGAAHTISILLGTITLPEITILLIGGGITGIIAYTTTKMLAKEAMTYATQVNYQSLLLTTVGILFTGILLLTSWPGIILFLSATMTGIVCNTLPVRRTLMMGCIMVPTIILLGV